MSLADFLAESLTGTIWSSSPCRTRVGTSNFWRSSVKSVSETRLVDRDSNGPRGVLGDELIRGHGRRGVVDRVVRWEAMFGPLVGDDVERGEPGEGGQDPGRDGGEAECSGQ